jgi:peptidoglycan/xylan/chitin deacetylase (PgdA/CDA1 family)
MAQLPSLGRFPYSGIRTRPVFEWPNGSRLAVHVAINLEHFIFGEGGVDLDRVTPAPNHRSYLWRDYGNRVGVWRLLDLFDELGIPIGAITNSSIYEHCPETVAAFRERGDEIIAHGATNSKKPAEMDEDEETEMVREVTATIAKHEGAPPAGWLTPYLTPSEITPDILKEAGYRYILDWGICDDQPFWTRTRSGPLLAVPYPLELNDQPAIVFRRDTASQFCDMIIDHFDEHLHAATRYPAVCSISLHHFIMGQPFRLRHLRRALQHIVERRDDIWLTTPGEIARHYASLPEDRQVHA